jgi:hypothetical protein
MNGWTDIKMLAVALRSCFAKKPKKNVLPKSPKNIFCQKAPQKTEKNNKKQFLSFILSFNFSVPL